MRMIRSGLAFSFVLALALLLEPAPAEAGPPCGDFKCTGGESCATCPVDCCATFCGDAVCDPDTETCATCSADCGACPVGCGDLICSDVEDCGSCSSDCGACPGYYELNDFATCPDVLPVCDETTNDCCKRPFGSFDGNLPIIIPMDRCHQPMVSTVDVGSGSKYDIPTQPAAWCANPGVADAPGQSGMIYAYGLVYRLMQHDIPVYWAINPTKDPQTLNEVQPNAAAQTYTDRDIDMWILSPDDADLQPPSLGDSLSPCGAGCTPPVVRLDASLTAVEDYSMTEFPVRGSAFIIAGKDRARFEAFMTRTGEFAALVGNSYYDFSTVDMYEIQDGARIQYQSFRSVAGPYPVTTAAPIAVTLDTPPPRLAVQEGGPARVWLAAANLDQAAAPGCELGLEFSPADAVYCDVTNAEIDGNALIDGGFNWAWLHGPGLPCTAMDDLDAFMTAVPDVKDGHHVMFMETALADSEGCADGRFLGMSSAGVASVATAGAAPYVLRYPANIIAQIGDVPAGFAQGSPSKWTYDDGAGSNLYQAAHYAWGAGGTLIRLVSEDANTVCTAPLNKSTGTCDLFGPGQDDVDFIAYIRHKDVPENGIAFYAAGNNISPQSTTAHLRMTMNAFLALPTGTVDVTPPLVFVEVSRAAPVISNWSSTGEETLYHGSFDRPDPAPGPDATTFPESGALFKFPHVKGHFRAQLTSALAADPVFDVRDSGKIPPAVPGGCGAYFTGTCRTVFTNTEGGRLPTPVFFETGNAGALNDYLDDFGAVVDLTDAQAETLITKVLQAKLGGVDRSTPAIIEPSRVVPEGTVRPIMAYFGGLDGGLHAVCIDAVSPCTFPGQELWSYIPRTQLPALRLNQQRIDGSPSVADLFGDFDDDGTNEWRTVLSFQTGSGEASNPLRAPLVVALDITQPGSPRVLWDYETSGVGLTLASGPVRIGPNTEPAVFAVTNRGGTTEAGIVVTAIHAATGEKIWANDLTYPAPRDAAHVSVPKTGIPGGASAIDMVGDFTLTHVIVPTLYGDLWVFEADTGGSVYEDGPLFRFAEDHHPIGAPATIYRDLTSGKLHALVASGGYAAPFDTSWAPADVNQYIVSVNLETPVGAAPITEDLSSDFGGNRAFVIDLGPGKRVYSQVVVAGNELFVVTDTEDINLDTYGLGAASGELSRFSLDDGAAKGTPVSVQSGAGGVDVTSSGKAIASSGTEITAETPADFTEGGESVELGFQSDTGREVWLLLR